MFAVNAQRQPLVPVPALGRILLYVCDIGAVTEFNARHFGFQIHKEEGDRVVELESSTDTRITIMLHPLGCGRRSDQSAAKLIFDVLDVGAFFIQAAERGLVFGPCIRPTAMFSPIPKILRAMPFPYRAGFTHDSAKKILSRCIQAVYCPTIYAVELN